MMMVASSSLFVNVFIAVQSHARKGGRSSGSSRCRRHGGGESAEVHLVRCGIAEGLVKAPRVVEREVLRQRAVRLMAVRVRPQVDLLVLHAPPQPLDEYVVDPATLAVHVDRDAGGFQRREPLLAGELRTL